MTTVYLVTSGEYSDYSINGVFSTEQLAEEFAAKIEGGEVDPWELDERSQEENCPCWVALLDLATELLSVRNQGSVLCSPSKRVDTAIHTNYKSKAHPKGYILSRSYVSQEHADKLCVEKKQEIQRQGGV